MATDSISAPKTEAEWDAIKAKSLARQVRTARLKYLLQEARTLEIPEGMSVNVQPFQSGYVVVVCYPTPDDQRVAEGYYADGNWKINLSDEEMAQAGQWALDLFNALPYHDLMEIRRGAKYRDLPGQLRYIIILRDTDSFNGDTDWYFEDIELKLDT